MSNAFYTLDFNTLAAGTIVDDEFAAKGLEIYAYRDDENGEPNKAMIFDSADPTGGDDDLATDNLEKVLIISEDGKSQDPDDNGDGGVMEFRFDAATHVDSLTILDFEEGGRIKLFDDHGNLLKTVHVSSPNNGQKVIDLDTDDVAKMKVELHGSGAVDNLVFSNEFTGPDPDGAVDGEASGELMELGYDDSNAPTDQGGDIITNDADLIFGNGGDDTIDGEGGDDTIFGDSGPGAVSTTLVRESFEWDKLPDPNGGGSIDDNDPITDVTQNTGNVNVSFKVTGGTAGVNNQFGDEHQNVDGIDDGTETIATDSSFNSDLTPVHDGTQTYEMTFDQPVENVDFRINDADGSAKVTVIAYDADGNQIPVDFDLGDGLSSMGADGFQTKPSELGEYEDEDSSDFSALVEIAGPVAKIEIVHSEGDFNSGIWITDVYFDVAEDSFDPGVGGNDIIEGSDGDDITYGDDGLGFGTLSIAEQIADQDGAGGDDTFIGGEGADQSWGEGGDDVIEISSVAAGAGDVVVGGNGPDDTADNDVLDLRGTGKVTITATADASDEGAQTGTVEFEDGSTLQFFQIETILTDPQNEAPTAVDDTVEVDEDDSVTFNPAANDIDPDGDPLEVVSIGDPANGQLIDNGDGTYTYTPDPNFNGPDQISYTVQDPSGEQSTATITFDVAPINDAPDAVNDTATTPEDTVIVLNPLDNDTDVDGDTLEITSASVPDALGTVEIVGDTIVYTPAPDYNGPATISYAITDGNGGTDVAEIVVDVTPVNDAPVAQDDLVETPEDTAVTFNPAANDSDPDGDPLTVVDAQLTDPAQGDLSVDPTTNEVTFTPAPNFNGPVEITYTVEDPDGLQDSGTVIVNVGEAPDAPEANDDTATTPEDTPVVISPLGNDTDPDGDPLTITFADVPADQGTVTFTDDTITFTPAPDFNGDATITYAITDGNGGTDSADIVVDVTPVNDAPETVDDIINTPEDTAVTFNPVANDIDPDGDDLTLVDAELVDPSTGDLSVDPTTNEVTFTPAPDFNGPVEITYTVEDPDGLQDTGTATVNVGAENDNPIANDDMATTPQGTEVTILPLENDSDPDGDDIRVISAAEVPPAQGTVSFTDDTIVFTPAPAFVGEAEITYTISDGGGLTDSAIVTVDVTDVIGPVDGLDTGEVMLPGYTDLEGDQIDGFDGDDDTIFGNGGDDIIDSGEGDDTVTGDGGDDIFEITDTGSGIDNDVLTGGETDEDGPGDSIDGSDISDDLTVTFSAPETGTITDGVDTITFEEIERVETGSGDDTVTGSDGDDYISTRGGDDSMVGGDGNDTLISGDGLDTVEGGAGDDSLVGGDEADTIMGGADNDTIEGGRGGDELDGEEGDDSIVGGNDGDTITGGAGADEMIGNDGSDVFVVDSAVDATGDVVTGGNGPDDTVDNDVLDLRGAGRVTIDAMDDATDDGALTGTVTFEETGETLSFSQIEDILTDGPAADGIVDGEEFGELMGPGYDDSNAPTDQGGDMIDGDDGIDDVIEGNGGDDTIDSGEGDDTVDGGAGDDIFEITDTGSGIDNDSIIGGETEEDGVGDSIDGGHLSDDLTVTFSAPETGTITDGVDTTTFEEIERIETGSGDDTVTGSDGDDYVSTRGGDDSMVGGDGNDTLISGDGDDTVDGGEGDDSLVGGDEFDSIMGGEGDDTIDGGRGGDELDGGAGDDSILGGADDDTITGGDGSDIVEGGEGNNVIDTSGTGLPLLDDKNGDGFGFGPYGPLPPAPADPDEDDDRDLVTTGSGDDTITTGDDADTIFGGSGDNVIDSGIDNDEVTTTFGNDFIVTGEGADTVSSGAGNDTIFGGLDPIFPDELNIPDEGSFPTGGDPDTENGRDSIEAGAGEDLVFGQDDDDTIRGGGGADTLDGGVDDDSIFGDNGQDDLIGGQGADTMFGGADRDEFLIDNREDAFGDIADGGTDGNDVDRLDLRGLGRFEIVNETVDADGDSTSGTVNFLAADGVTIEGTLEFAEIENLIPCFTPGALIATPRGEVKVEDLQAGDRVITRDDGIQEIHWIGQKALSAQDMLADPKLKPVLIKKGALGNNLPERDMMVSPNHRMLIANENTQMLFDEREVLVAAKHLVGQAGIYQLDTLGIDYIHVMFARHQVILADGSWTESFQPGDQTVGGFDEDQREELYKLFPSLADATGRKAYASARQSLKAFEARTLRETMSSK